MASRVEQRHATGFEILEDGGSRQSDLMDHEEDSSGHAAGAREEGDESCEESEASGESDEEEEIDQSVLEEMENFATTFRGIDKRYRLINRIGEGEPAQMFSHANLHFTCLLLTRLP
jgi:cell division control protein 7